MSTPARPAVAVELCSVPGCPNLPAARQRLLDVLDTIGTPWTLAERQGDYPSPSILVNGVDVTGAPVGGPAACVLHPPTADQIRAAIDQAITAT